MRADVTRLIQRWDDALADRIAANNLFLDRAKERRHLDIDALREKHGACSAEGAFVAENALRGAWVMPCERGALRVAITLAPVVPPKVQYLVGAVIGIEHRRLARRLRPSRPTCYAVGAATSAGRRG